MCHFVTLVVSEVDQIELRAIMSRRNRRVKPIDNPSVAELLLPGEHQYLTARFCDCGTALGRARNEENKVAQTLERQRMRLSRIGWSETKMERWVRDRLKADERRQNRPNVDKLEDWDCLLRDLKSAGVPKASLLLHSYVGALDAEFDCTRLAATSDRPRIEQLAWLEEDVLTDFATG